MAAADMTTVECGFCLRRDECMIDPVILPCDHTHCKDCLADLLSATNSLTCPYCATVCDVDLKSLPSSKNPVHLNWCDVCARKGVERQTATDYCIQCMQKYCDSHKASHSDFFVDHKSIAIEEYKLHSRKFETKFCRQHQDSPYSSVCQSCEEMYCNACLYGLDTECVNGGKHQLVPVDQLSSSLKDNAHLMVARVIAKEEEMATFYKETSKRLSAFDSATSFGVVQLRTSRDEQIQTIKDKYDSLENTFQRKRDLVQGQLTEFLEDKLTPAQTAIRSSRLQIVAKLVNSHPVDLISEHKEVMSVMQKLIEEELPALELDHVVELQESEPKRDIEMSLVEKKLVVNSQLGVSLPKSLTLIKKIMTRYYCRGISLYKGSLYVSLIDKKVDKMEEMSSKPTEFIDLRGEGNGVIVHADQIYTLCPGEFTAYSLDGQLMYRWAHRDKLTAPTKMAIVCDQVVIPDRLNKQLAVYSFAGSILKQIPWSFTTTGFVSICAFAEDSVIVSDASSNTVARVNISSGATLWTHEMEKPQGVAGYGNKYVFVAAEGSDQIAVLDSDTGELMSELKHQLISSGHHVFDLQVVDNILVVPAYGQTGPVLFYRLED